MNKLSVLLTVVAAIATSQLAPVTTSQLALAAPPPAPSEPPKPQKKKFNFEGDTISTDYLKPGTMLIEGVSRGRRSSLIEVRLDFVNEILRSADDI